MSLKQGLLQFGQLQDPTTPHTHVYASSPKFTFWSGVCQSEQFHNSHSSQFSFERILFPLSQSSVWKRSFGVSSQATRERFPTDTQKKNSFKGPRCQSALCKGKIQWLKVKCLFEVDVIFEKPFLRGFWKETDGKPSEKRNGITSHIYSTVFP